MAAVSLETIRAEAIAGVCIAGLAIVTSLAAFFAAFCRDDYYKKTQKSEYRRSD
jgi:hypothetical protein